MGYFSRALAITCGVGLLGGPAWAQPGAAPTETTVSASTTEALPSTEASTEAIERSKTIDVGGFLGLDYFGSDIELGNAWASEQIPGTSFVLGGRVGVTLLPDLMKSSRWDPALGIEGELKLALGSTGESMDGGRGRYFAPVLGWRLHGIARLRSDSAIHPHFVIGVGGESVVSGSPFMADDTDAQFYVGPGLSWRKLRFDLRWGMTAGRTDTVAHTLELHIGIERSFDFGGKRVETMPPPPPPPADTDGDGIIDDDDDCDLEPETVNDFEDGDGCPDTLDKDGDGILDADDQCVDDPETVNQIDDEDGCPELDEDGDGVLGSKDGCPAEAEDFDQHEDEDGCPELDNDLDGVPDRSDGCPMDPETFNGFEDSDGCPDELPKVVKQFTGVIKGITFEYGKARIQKKSKKTLNAAAKVMLEYPDMRLLIEGHTDNKGLLDKNMSLSQRRADAVKWYLVDLGIGADRIETKGVGPDRPLKSNKTKKGRDANRRIEFHLIIDQPATPPPVEPPPAEPPAPEQPSTPPQ